MAEKIGEVYVESSVKGAKKSKKDIEKIGKQLQKTSHAMKGDLSALQSSFGQLAAGIAAVGVVAIALGRSFVLAASEAEETTNKFNVTFRGIIEQANEMARQLQQSYGLSIRESQALLSNTGDLLTGFGFTRESALDLSNQVQRLSVDLASFTNLEGGAARASRIITAALTGETESLKGLGVVINQTVLQQRALAEGMTLVNGQLSSQQRAQLTLQLITEQSANAMGDFARSSDSYANRSRV